MSKENKNKVFKCTDHAVNLSSRLQSLYEQQEFFDIDLIAGIDNVKVQANRIVLSASSNYFHAMFCNTEAAVKEAKLGNVDGETLKSLIGFLYTGCIEFSSEGVVNLLKAADFYQVDLLVGACCDFLANELVPSNCLGVAFFADQHKHRTLYDKAIRYACGKLPDLFPEKEFLQLDEQHLLKFLFSHGFFADCPKSVFYAVLVWVEHDKSKRTKLTNSLMSHVRFALLEPEFIIENSEALCNCLECYELMRKWLEWHLSPETRWKVQADQYYAENDDKKIAFITGTSDFHVQIFDPVLNQWSYTDWPSPPNKRVGYSTTVINGKLLIVGGKISGHITNIVECLDLQNMEWSELPPMTLARCLPGLANLNGHLYVVGGKTGVNWSDSVEIFDFSLQAWLYVEPLRPLLSSIQVAVLNGHLYVVGNGNTSLQCYDPITCLWRTTAHKNINSINFGIAAVKGFLYAVGGERGGAKSETVERYDPSNNSWTTVSPLKLGRLFAKCSVLRNQLVACVGFDDHGEWINLVDMYDPETQKWTTLPPLLSHEFSTFSCLITI